MDPSPGTPVTRSTRTTYTRRLIGGLTWRRTVAALLGAALTLTAAVGPAAAKPAPDAAAPAAVIPPSDDAAAIEQRLNQLLYPALAVAQDTQVRAIIRNAVGRRFDGDNNVLLSTVIQEVEWSGVLNPGEANWVAFKNAAANFANINGHRYDPQILIPNYEDGVLIGSTVTMAYAPANEAATTLTGYQMVPGGGIYPVTTITEAYSETNEVWVLSVNEPVPTGGPVPFTVTPGPAKGAPGKGAPANGAPAQAAPAAGASTMAACNPTGLRNERGYEYLQRFKVPSPSSLEPWWSGKLEMRMIIIGKGGAEIKNAYFGKIKRKDIRNWVNRDLFITTWDRGQWGDYWAYKWVEVDNGPTVELSLGFTAKILEALSVTGTVKATFTAKDDDAGSGMVGFAESTYLQYGTGTVDWNVCSVGGDGGTGNDNLARSGIASASTTYPGYAPSKVNDGSTNTTVGGAYSWANANGARMPQWVQVDFGVEKTFRRLVVYTSATYPIQDFDVQVWNGAGYVTVQPVRGNTQASMTIDLGFPRTSRLVRINGLRGPSHQPQYVRVNELEVYAN
ncbi:MAG TPA: discoidin domain-containing protein [Pilimelia sp.]|nr:discoidin domain-containing protein [Pilimelia sp.]